MRSIVFLLVIAQALVCYAQDIRAKVQTERATGQITNVIDPDSSIYGIPYGTTEDEFVAQFGNPMGYMRMSGNTTCMIYGKSHGFIFEDGKLIGVRITDLIFDWKMSLSITGQSPFDGIQWKLTNGIRAGMNLADVKRILGQSLSGDEYDKYYETSSGRVELEFAHYTDEGNTDTAHKVTGILVKKH